MFVTERLRKEGIIQQAPTPPRVDSPELAMSRSGTMGIGETLGASSAHHAKTVSDMRGFQHSRTDAATRSSTGVTAASLVLESSVPKQIGSVPATSTRGQCPKTNFALDPTPSIADSPASASLTMEDTAEAPESGEHREPMPPPPKPGN